MKNKAYKSGYKLEDCVSRITISHNTSKEIIDSLRNSNINCETTVKTKRK